MKPVLFQFVVARERMTSVSFIGDGQFRKIIFSQAVLYMSLHQMKAVICYFLEQFRGAISFNMLWIYHEQMAHFMHWPFTCFETCFLHKRTLEKHCWSPMSCDKSRDASVQINRYSLVSADFIFWYIFKHFWCINWLHGLTAFISLWDFGVPFLQGEQKCCYNCIGMCINNMVTYHMIFHMVCHILYCL